MKQQKKLNLQKLKAARLAAKEGSAPDAPIAVAAQ